jgi:hypothetical protein
MTIGESSIPLARKAGSYWKAATREPSSREAAPIVLPHSRTSATVAIRYPRHFQGAAGSGAAAPSAGRRECPTRLRARPRLFRSISGLCGKSGTS